MKSALSFASAPSNSSGLALSGCLHDFAAQIAHRLTLTASSSCACADLDVVQPAVMEPMSIAASAPRANPIMMFMILASISGPIVTSFLKVSSINATHYAGLRMCDTVPKTRCLWASNLGRYAGAHGEGVHPFICQLILV